MKPLYIGGAIVLFLLWQRGAQARQAELIVNEGFPANGTDWMACSWSRLFGSDLGYNGVLPGLPCPYTQ